MLHMLDLVIVIVLGSAPKDKAVGVLISPNIKKGLKMNSKFVF